MKFSNAPIKSHEDEISGKLAKHINQQEHKTSSLFSSQIDPTIWPHRHTYARTHNGSWNNTQLKQTQQKTNWQQQNHGIRNNSWRGEVEGCFKYTLLAKPSPYILLLF